MSKEIAKVENKQVSVGQVNFNEIVNKDIQLPRILLSQAMSDRVKSKKCVAGDFILTGVDKVVAKEGEELRIVPLLMRSVWVLYSKETKKGTFRGIEARTNANANLPWDYEVDGVPYKRVQGVELYGLLPSQILAYSEAIKQAEESGEIPDLSSVITPVGLSFQSTSFKTAGRPVTEFFTKIQSMRMSLPTLTASKYLLSFVAEEVTNEEGSFYVMKLSGTSSVKKEYPETHTLIDAESDKWAATLQGMNVVMESDEVVESAPSVDTDLV